MRARIDVFMDRLEKSSKIMGVRLFLSNPRDSEGNPIVLKEKDDYDKSSITP